MTTFAGALKHCSRMSPLTPPPLQRFAEGGNREETGTHDLFPTHTHVFLNFFFFPFLAFAGRKKKTHTNINSRHKPSPAHIHRHTPCTLLWIMFLLYRHTHVPSQIKQYHFKLFEQQQQTHAFTHRSSCPNTHTTLTARSPDCLLLICSRRVRVCL